MNTEYSKAAFDRAVDAISTTAAIKDRAKTYEDRVWCNDALPKVVEPYCPGLEFWVEGPRLTIDVMLLPTEYPLPEGLTRSETTFLEYCHQVDPDDRFTANSAYDIVNRAYDNNLHLGAYAVGSGDTIWASIYGRDVTTTALVEPAS